MNMHPVAACTTKIFHGGIRLMNPRCGHRRQPSEHPRLQMSVNRLSMKMPTGLPISLAMFTSGVLICMLLTMRLLRQIPQGFNPLQVMAIVSAAVHGNTIILATSDVRAATEVAQMSHYPFTDFGWRREWDRIREFEWCLSLYRSRCQSSRILTERIGVSLCSTQKIVENARLLVAKL